MIPAASAAGAAVPQPGTSYSAARTAQAPAPEAARLSAGETAPANIKLATSNAVTAPEQTAVAPRLRDQETAERTQRASPGTDAPTGPPPSFEESPLERQARVAFDPPELPAVPEYEPPREVAVEEVASDAVEEPPEIAVAEAPPDPPPTPSERAEASFAETKSMATEKEPATVDVSR